MKKILLGATAAVLLITGCAQNELLDGGVVTPNDGKIRFSGTTGLVTTKAAPGNPYNSTADLQGTPGTWREFAIVGYSGNTAIVGAGGTPQIVRFNGTSWEYSNEPYWPNTSMNFFAYANWDNPPTITETGITATNVVIASDKGSTDADSYKQKDLLVAATLSATKEVRTLLTFKHALTQIVFKAGNINPNKIDVRIGGVEIVNVGSTGTMNLTATDPAIKWTAAGNSDVGIIPNGTAVGSINPTETRASYGVAGIDGTPLTTALKEGFNVPTIALGSENDYTKYPRIQTALEPNNNALILMPQNFKSWDVNSGIKAANQFGAYIKLTVLIKDHNLTDPGAPNAGAFIYAGSINGTSFSYGTVYIPVESLEGSVGQWVPGKRINYIITFGDSNSGSGGGGYDENGDPILVPIRFRAVVEDWVETNVPLLTATFEAKSDAITHKFIDGYTNQLLNDIKAAPAPKVYHSEIKIKGTVSSLIGSAPDLATTNTGTVTFQELLGSPGTFQNAKFRPGSTLVFNFNDVGSFNGQTIKVLVPTGWEGRSYSAREGDGSFSSTKQVFPTSNVASPSGGTLEINGTARYAVLTKVATTAYSYICQIPYIEDNLAAIELNENQLTNAVAFNNTVFVKGTFPVDFVGPSFKFSTDMLSKFTTAHNGSTVTIDLAGITEATWNTLTWVPTGWSATVGGVAPVIYPNDPITVTHTSATKTIVFTKTASGITRSYIKAAIMIPQLNAVPNNSVFYWDNVDYNVAIDLSTANPFAAATWDNLAAGKKVTIKLKHPLLSGNVKNLTGNWTAAENSGYITDLIYTK